MDLELKSGSDVFMVVDSLNSIFFPDSIREASNEYIFYITLNISVSVIAYNKTDDKHFFKVTETKSDSTKINVKLTEVSLEDIRNAIPRVSENVR